MKLTNFLATHRYEVRRARRTFATCSACVFVVRALRNDAPIGRTIILCTFLALSVWAIMFCFDRAIGIMSPIVIDLRKVKGISAWTDGRHIYIENASFMIKAFDSFDHNIDSFQLFEKVEAGDLKLESNFTSLTGENCLLRLGDEEFKLDAGLAKHLLAVLNCHAEANHACRGLSFLA